jgi:hypothetical protein
VRWEARRATAHWEATAGDDGWEAEAGSRCDVQGGGEVAPDLFEGGGRLARRVWSARGGRAEDRRDVVPIFSRRSSFFSRREGSILPAR